MREAKFSPGDTVIFRYQNPPQGRWRVWELSSKWPSTNDPAYRLEPLDEPYGPYQTSKWQDSQGRTVEDFWYCESALALVAICPRCELRETNNDYICEACRYGAS